MNERRDEGSQAEQAGPTIIEGMFNYLFFKVTGTMYCNFFIFHIKAHSFVVNTKYCMNKSIILGCTNVDTNTLY